MLEPIDRQTTIDNIYDAAESIICTVEEENPEIAERIIDVRDVILKKIEKQSVIEPKVRRGQWEEDTSRGSYSIYCSCCGSHKETICPSNFCPNCGADMREGGI